MEMEMATGMTMEMVMTMAVAMGMMMEMGMVPTLLAEVNRSSDSSSCRNAQTNIIKTESNTFHDIRRDLNAQLK